MGIHPGRLVPLAAGLTCGGARARTDAGWVVDVTWTYEARSSRRRAGEQTGPAGTDIGSSETNDGIDTRRKGLIGRGRHARTHVEAGSAAEAPRWLRARP